MNINGMELLVLEPAQAEKFFKTVSVFVPLDNLNKKENALTIQSAKMEPTGTEKNASEFHAIQELHTVAVAHAVKSQFLLAQQVLIGMATDVCMLLTSAHLVWFGKTSNAEVIQQNALEIHTNSTELVFLFHQDAHQVWPGITPTVAPQPATLAQLDLTTTELSAFHSWLAKTAESGTILSVNVYAHKAHFLTELHA